MSTVNEPSEDQRLHYLDRLRTFTVFAVLVGYWLLPFSGADWLVHGEMLLPLAPLLTIIGNQFVAPMLFFVSGAATRFSLESRSPDQVIRERLCRLGVPLVVMTAVLLPVQVHFYKLVNWDFKGTVLEALPLVFNPAVFENVDASSTTIFSAHLGWLLYLLLVSIIALPLFIWLRSESGRTLTRRLSRVGGRRGGILIFMLPVVIVMLLLRALPADLQIVADIVFWLCFYILGYVFFTDQTYIRAIRRNTAFLLLVVAVSLIVVLLIGLSTAFDVREIFNISKLGNLLSSPGTYILTGALLMIASFATVLLGLSFAARRLDFANQQQVYLSEASLPLYLIFPPILIIISYYILQIRAEPGVKLVILGLSAAAFSGGLYELFIRRFHLLRIALGMRQLNLPVITGVPHLSLSIQRLAYLAIACVFAVLIVTGMGIDLNGDSTVSQWQIIKPGGDTICGQGTPYQFFVREGINSDRLMLYFQAGGACWNAATCSKGSLVTDHTVGDPDEELGWYHGIFDLENPANPVSDYNIVFVPYCTSDLHTGAADVTYTDFVGNQITINHQGVANSRAVLGWVYDHYQSPARVLLIGTSAGTIGSIYFAPDVMDHYSDSEVIQLGDGLVGIMPDDWQAPYVWKSDENVSPIARDRVLSGEPGEIVNNLYLSTAEHYAQHRFGIFTTAADVFQIGYFNLAGGDISIWADLMNDRLDALDNQLPNFNSYVAPGLEHTVLALPSFYTTEVDGIYFRDWFASFIEGKPVPNVRCERGKSYCP